MAGEWKTVPLTDLYDIGSGLSKPRSEFGFGNGFLTFKDVLDNYFVPDQLSALVNSTEKEQANCSIRRGDIFLTRTSETQSELGMSSVALKDYPKATFNGFTKRLRPKVPDAIVPEYAAYYFRGPRFRQSVTAMSSLSTRASLNNEMISRLNIVLPPIPEQKAIGIILKALDDKIELNRRRNRTLEAQARALFQSWFVDFDPVKARVAGRQPPGLKPELAALFPAELEGSPVGPIPAGWRVGTIGELADIVGGSTPSTKNEAFWHGGTHNWATPKDLSNLSVPVLLDTERSITDAGLGCISSGLLPEGTVLLSSRAPIGYLAINQVPVAVNQGFIAMKPKTGVPSQYLLRWAQASQGAILSRANGSTFLEISKASFRPISIVVPANGPLQAFDKICDAMFEQVVSSERQVRTLASLRNVLLPKLISGTLRISDAERIVGRCA